MRIYAVKLPCNAINDVYDKVLSYTEKKKQEQLKRYLNKEDSMRSLISYVLIRIILCEKTNQNIKDIMIQRNEFGKPYLQESNMLEFNVSHSGDWVVAAIDELPIGIDVEKIKKINYINISKRFFTQEENSALINHKESEQLKFFYDIWTLKESYIKAKGKGLSIPLNSFSIVKNEDNIILNNIDEKMKCYFKQYNLETNYPVSVCSYSNNFCDNIEELECKSLFDKYCLLNMVM